LDGTSVSLLDAHPRCGGSRLCGSEFVGAKLLRVTPAGWHGASSSRGAEARSSAVVSMA